jgi:hypothetical protein
VDKDYRRELDEDVAFSIIQSSDGGYVVAGWTNSFGAGGDDMYVVKLDSSGNVQWTKTIGGSNWDEAYSIIQSSDGGYVVAGYTSSFGAGGSDFYVVKLAPDGTLGCHDRFQNPITSSGGTVDISNIIFKFTILHQFLLYLPYLPLLHQQI